MPSSTFVLFLCKFVKICNFHEMNTTVEQYAFGIVLSLQKLPDHRCWL